ncbi:uncharacterized protein N7459_005189 [Penicillium hispanicum]|uniref:uncharacterized protein n=1 Tax=Penicillium hispanicum TaxID=1080232 RepID=UPI002540EBD4|nr:uncharacterized protein N7459_005189 [Penicillium hispanicum]KAJ5585389.1 hypothetical protein N7459_005189 [Penicillium hispanicum]
MERDMDVDSDEWEYEYDDSETETFYLNLDLTSLHGLIRPPRRRQEDSNSNHETPTIDANGAQHRNEPNVAHPSKDAYVPLDSAEADISSERIQIVGLHTCNPIISYYNQIFSCSWADQIGTELIFAHPDTDPDTDHTLTRPLRQGPGFELLAANSVKILGRKANITSGSGTGLAQDSTPNLNLEFLVETPSSHAPSSTGVPRRPGGPSHQSQFIQRLQSAKAAKGQSDTVRTVMSTRRNVNIADRLSAWGRTEAQVAEVQQLNKRAAEGDQDALDTLELLLRVVTQSSES